MKHSVKATVFVTALIVVLPCVLACRINQFIFGRVQGFEGWSQLMSLIPGQVGVLLRQTFYFLLLKNSAKNACISFGTVFSHPTVQLGNSAYVGIGCMIGDVTLEDDVLIGSHVSIINGNRQHGIDRLDLPVREQPGVYPRITVGRDTWIGDRAVVMASIGNHCVVGAGAVVTKEIPDFAIAVGNPARIIGSRNGAESKLNSDETQPCVA